MQYEGLIVRCSRDSFANLSRWLVDARALASPHLVVVLVGNKSDREEDREVEWEEASRWAAEHSMYSCDGETISWLIHDRCPLPRDILADRRQRGGTIPAGCTIHFAIDRIWNTRSREGRERCELRRSRVAARE
jgi:GTPase SAR1 family protein